jgi:hypothetical protein
VEDVTGDEVVLDLAASHVAVIGRPRSGRSMAMVTVAAGLASRHEVYAVGPSTSGLAAASVELGAFGGPDQIAPLLEHVVARARSGRDRAVRPVVLLVDDLDRLDDFGLAHQWERVAMCPELRVVAATDVSTMTGFTSNPVAATIKRSRQMLVLQPDDPGEFLQITGVRLDLRPGTRWVPGRGAFVADRVPKIVQVAICDDTVRRTPVRSRDTLSDVTVISTPSLRTAAVATPTPR